jgi:RNase P subunit RPR2
MTDLPVADGWPCVAARARCRSNSGTDNPAIPAKLALTIPRRSTTAIPSRVRAFQCEKACDMLQPFPQKFRHRLSEPPRQTSKLSAVDGRFNPICG